MRELEIAIIAAKKAGEQIRASIGNVKIGQKSSSFNLVTDADTAAQQCISEIIHSVFEQDVIFGEEGGVVYPLDAARLWIIDPIDGTTNFAHSIPHFSISIAFACKGVVQCGVVYNPNNEELYSAVVGNGAFCNGIRINVSPVATLDRAVIATGFFYERGPLMLKTLDTIKNLLVANIQGIRRMGSAALDLCYVACGRYDGYFEYRLSTWDFAAGLLIVREAGGICLDSDGNNTGLFSRGMICSNTNLNAVFSAMTVWKEALLIS